MAKTYYRLLFSLVSICSFLFFPSTTFATNATMTFFPSTGNYKAGNIFSVDLKIATNGTSFNATQGKVLIPDTLAVQSLTLGDCGMSFVITPSVADPSFAGVILGESATNCTVYTMKLQAQKAGDGDISVQRASIREANSATELLDNTPGTTYTITASSFVPNTPTPSSPPTSSGSPNTYALNLQIIDSNDTAVPDAVVVVQDATDESSRQQAVADTTGNVQFSNVPAGTNKVTIYDKNKNKVGENIITLNGKSPEVTLTLHAQQNNAYLPWLWYIIPALLIIAIVFFVIYKFTHRNKTEYPTVIQE